MKRIFILVVIALLAVGSSFANERTLIDFSTLATGDFLDELGNPQHQVTLMDFSNEATGNFTARQRRTMQSSLAIRNWDVVFSSSSRNATTRGLSLTQESASQLYSTVMGVRVHFPTGPVNSWARIQPPFSIPAFHPTDPDDPQSGKILSKPSVFEGPVGEPAYGIVKNVGTLKSIAVEVYGLNFPHSLAVVLVDEHGVERTYNMGSLNFEGWGILRWDNPAYVANVRNRDLRLTPVYPDNTPYVKFAGFIIQKQANVQGGDFIAYFKKVDILYDLAVDVIEDADIEINHESEWNIIFDRDNQRRTTDMQRLGQLEVQRQMDLERQVPADTSQNFGRYSEDNE